MSSAARALFPPDDDGVSGAHSEPFAPFLGLTARSRDVQGVSSGRPMARSLLTLIGSIAITIGVMFLFAFLSRGWH